MMQVKSSRKGVKEDIRAFSSITRNIYENAWLKLYLSASGIVRDRILLSQMWVGALWCGFIDIIFLQEGGVQ